MVSFNGVRALVKARGIKQPPGANKIELVRLLQGAEGNFDCFGTAVDGVCDQFDCVWREDCFKSAGATK